MKKDIIASVVVGLAMALGVIFVRMYLDMPSHSLNFMWLAGAFIPVLGLLLVAAWVGANGRQ